VQGKQAVRIDGSWRAEEGEKNFARIHQFMYDPSDLDDAGTVDDNDVGRENEAAHEIELPMVQYTNKRAGTQNSTDDALAQLVWLFLGQRGRALLEARFVIGLQDDRRLNQSCCVTPQWCFLQAIWAQNLEAAERLLELCGKTINVNHKYQWDVIPWDETVAHMCWRECHGNAWRDRPWMKALAWLASEGAVFSQVKLNFHRRRKPWSMQESQIRTFNRLVWHLSDEMGGGQNQNMLPSTLEGLSNNWLVGECTSRRIRIPILMVKLSGVSTAGVLQGQRVIAMGTLI